MESKIAKLYPSSHNELYYYKHPTIQLIRPLTLTGTISPIIAGTGLAMLHGEISWELLLALLASALLIQSATNVLNDYFDFKYGQDKEKWVCSTEADHGPAHQSLPLLAGIMIIAAIIIGIWLALHSSLWVIVLGMLGISAGYKYSGGHHSFSSIGLGETVAALFLGPVITLLAYFVQTNTITLPSLAVSFVFAMLIASMILTNNIRDYEKDIGFRKTLVFRLGRESAIQLLKILLFLPYLAMSILVYIGILSSNVLISIIAIPIALRLIWSFRRKASREDEARGMKWAARHHWAFGMLLAFGIWIL